MKYSSSFKIRRSVLCLIGVLSIAQFGVGLTLLMRQDPASIGMTAQQSSVSQDLKTIIIQKHATLMLDEKL